MGEANTAIVPQAVHTIPKMRTLQQNIYSNDDISPFSNTNAAAVGKTMLTKHEQNAPINPTTRAKNGSEMAAATHAADSIIRMAIEHNVVFHDLVSSSDSTISSTINDTGFMVNPNFVIGLITMRHVAILAMTFTRSLDFSSPIMLSVISLAVDVPYIKYPSAATDAYTVKQTA